MGIEEDNASVEISEHLLLECEELSSSREAELERIPEWKDQITMRGLVVSAVLGTLFCIITHKLNLTVGIIPSLNVAAGLLGFFFVKSWTGLLSKFGVSIQPFTRQENTVIQTCVVACYGLAFSGGFGSYLIAMDDRTYKLIREDYPGNRAEDVKNPGLGWMIGFLFVVSFLGLFSLVPLREVMVMDYKLTYPSGTATAMFDKQLPSLQGFILTLVQLMSDVVLSALTVNCSVLLGAIISWGFLWPYISQLAGHWYPADLGSNDFKGLYGCKVFTAISLILGDGLYNLIKIITITIKELCNTPKQKNLPVVNEVSVCKNVFLTLPIYPNIEELIVSKHASSDTESSKIIMEQRKRDEIFLKDRIPSWLAVSGYLVLAAISTATIPSIFPPLKWYLVLCSYVLVPALAFCNSYGTGLTDWSLASTYGKIGLFVISSLVGRDGGVIACLAACGVMMSIVSTAADLMQDFKTGYLTLSSAKSMFVSQLIGTAMGCVLAPLTFWLFWTAFDVGSPDGPYKAPYAVIFREMAILGIEGFSELPKHCLALCCGFFVAALVINLLRDVSPTKVSQFIPIPMAMAVPFYIGAYFAIDMFVGTVILYVWEQLNRKGAEDYAGAVASGLICGDGIWTIPSAILSIFRINPPICMYFRPSVSRYAMYGTVIHVWHCNSFFF
ncbi:hypothetical protein TEA_029065 [Camellia sinensis var. sinensis]|uniref:Metal-nicotianamine transporter YSL6 n=1 Tax=Camellia sinensis var. sinensis TaxID=542762 RepID=A0A4S4E860_CAMSN|nr:hypothetical protein TEA_029065 [Camellia sinensis var. sinensis]